MRVLVVSSYPPRHCGIAAYARDQVARLRAEGHEVVVLSPPDGNGDVRVPFLGGRAFFRAARMSGSFDRVVVQFQPALYYRPRAPVSKVLTSLGLWWLAARRPQLDLVIHEADPPLRGRPDHALLRWAFARAGRVSFHTDAERRALERGYRIRVRGALVSHTVRAVVPVSKEEARARLGLQNGRPLFVCAGFLQPSKGFDRAVEAFARAGNGGSLYIVGSIRDRTAENASFVERLRKRCGDVPGSALVERFLADEEFDLWVAAADWIVLPYRRSWSSGVLARAHALGTPAIVAAQGGLPEQAEGRDVVVRDDDELAGAFQRAWKAGDQAGPAAVDGNDNRAHGSGLPAQPPRHNVKDHPVSEALSEWDPEFEPPTPAKGKGMLFAFILVSVLLAALAQLTLKHGMTQVTHHGQVPLDLGRPVDMVRRVAVNLSVVLGLGTFVLSAAVWLVVLSRTSLSFAYPFVSLTYVIILLFDRLILRESVSALRWSGVAFIIAGLLLVSRTHQTG